jgi:hypothetical protein
MSQTKFVEYRDNGFWAYDVALGVFLKHLIDVTLERAETPGGEWLSEEIAEWRTIAVIQDYGLEINPSWSSAQLEIFIELVDQACAVLACRSQIASTEVTNWEILEDIRIHTRGATEVETGPVVELGRAIIVLARGDDPAAPAGKTWLYGAPEGRIAI